MPKERIYGRCGEAAPNNDLIVSWGKGTIVYDTEENDGDVYIAIGPQHEEQATISATFDRTSLNRLIRTLRRARDAAFGADV